MDVWISKCRHTSKCYQCKLPIVNHDYMVVCKLWRSKEGQAVRFPFVMRFHVECWVAKGKAAVDSHPKVETRGRQTVPMEDSVRTMRVKLLRRRAAVVQRINNEILRPPERQSIDRLIHLGAMLEELKQQIDSYGGAPKSW